MDAGGSHIYEVVWLSDCCNAVSLYLSFSERVGIRI
jgi:hypothetical protein